MALSPDKLGNLAGLSGKTEGFSDETRKLADSSGERAIPPDESQRHMPDNQPITKTDLWQKAQVGRGKSTTERYIYYICQFEN